MTTAKEIINALDNHGERWLCQDDQLTMFVKNGPIRQMIIMIWLNGRTFIMSESRKGEVKWWPWTRWRIAHAAKQRYFINTTAKLIKLEAA